MEVSKILERLDALIDMGDVVLRSRNYYSDIGITLVNEELFRQWRTSCLSFLNTLPHEYIYSNEFKNNCVSHEESHVMQGMGVLKAAKEDIEGGYLQKVEALVSAEVFNDFLEMAEHLLDNQYIHPAASLIGAVLEDGLRRICNNNGIIIKSREDISSLNQKLAAKGIYNPLQLKQIQVWNDIRNNADHGNFDQYKVDDVKEMLGGVRKFLTNYLV